MDGENNASKPYEQMDDFGGKNQHHPYFWFNTHVLQLLRYSSFQLFNPFNLVGRFGISCHPRMLPLPARLRHLEV